MEKIGIIITYFGILPEYFHHFLACCSFSTHINWFLFSDQQKPASCSENIFYYYFDIINFNKLASEKLGFPVQITDTYKLCDFKPAYGLIFEDFLKDYNYWGYCDTDMVIGDFRKFFTDDIFKNYDIISTYERFLSGPFCLYKNNKVTKNLFRTCPSHLSVLQNSAHLAFDENIRRKSLEGFSFRKIICIIFFLLKELPSHIKYDSRFVQLKYEFQWDFKKKNIIWNNPVDMTEAVFTAIHNKILNASFRQLLYSERFYRRIGQKNWQIKWESGILTDMVSGKEIFAFHFPDLKRNSIYKIDKYDPVKKNFIISESGIKND
jgi:hypothetical protein